MTDRRLLPMVALIASLILFVGALVFALRPTDQQRAVAPTATSGAAARSPVAGTIVAITQRGLATMTPEPVPTEAPTVAAASASSSARPSAALTTTTRIAPTAQPTVAAPIAAAPTVVPTAVTGASAGALPPAITPAAPPPASTPSPPPVVAVPPTVPPTPRPANVAPTVPPQPAPQPTATATKAPVVAAPPVASGPPPRDVGLPVRVIVPSLGVDASVEQVGVDAEGNMATPDDPWNTAWYAPGVRPGQAGNAAIAGHVDYHTIGPVVFWDLNKIAVGAEVLVVTSSGQTLRFTVRGGEYYRPQNAPLEEIFGATSSVNLNLITCGGTFNPVTREYDQRYVVFTTYAGQ